MPRAVKQRTLQSTPGSGRRCNTSVARAQEFYGITLEALAEAKNERLWFKTQLKLCSLWLKLHEYCRATKLLKELHRRGARCCGHVLVWRMRIAGTCNHALLLANTCMQIWHAGNGPRT